MESGGPLVDELQSEDVYNGGTEVQDEAADVTNEGNIEVHVAESRESDDESMIELYKHVLRTNRIKLKKMNEQVEYYRGKVDKQERIIDEMEEVCLQRIRAVRYFWKDLIYKEGSRSGMIVKRAMQRRPTL